MTSLEIRKKPKLIIQFNEANFDLIKQYSLKYELKGFRNIIDNIKNIETTSEKEYSDLEPWIQWYSFYSGKKLSEHQTYHLGDCLNKEHSLFPEKCSKEGMKVGIFGAMNLPPYKDYKIYIPDAWTNADSDSSISSKLISTTIRKIINSNANLSISFKQLIGLFILIGIPKSLTDLNMIFNSLKSYIYKSRENLASIFDYFFLKHSLSRVRNKKLDLSLIFLNGLAHVQHHYFLNSEFIDGINPEWYVKKGKDPLLASLEIYNEMFLDLYRRYENKYDIWLITGLSQAPFKNPQIYWRFKKHISILKEFFNFEFQVNPRMTRDFEIKTNNEQNLLLIEKFLLGALIKNSENKTVKAFDFIDKTSSTSIFASFVYDFDDKDVMLIYNGVKVELKTQLDFVAIKNGGHNQKGYVFSNSIKYPDNKDVPIWNLSKIILNK